MTPEERARKLVEVHLRRLGHGNVTLLTAEKMLVADIVAAMAEEREACAKIADRGCGECEHLATEPCAGNGLAAKAVAAAIRART